MAKTYRRDYGDKFERDARRNTKRRTDDSGRNARTEFKRRQERPTDRPSESEVA